MTEQQPGNGIELAHAAIMPTPQGGALPTGLEWQALERMATVLADSSLIPYSLKGKPGDVAVILLAAREYGIPPLMALSKLPVVNGKPAPMGELMVALVLRAGHSIRADFKAPDGSRYTGGPLTREHYGEAIVRRRDWPAGVEESLTFTLAEAISAGLVTIDRDGRPHAEDKKGNPTPWQLYTPNMARWRAVANVCRLYFPDVLLGLSYLPEELGAVVDEEGAPVEGEPVAPRGAPNNGTIEQRTAQESADKLAEQAWPDATLAAVDKAATDNGYIDAQVIYHGQPMTLREALHRHADERNAGDVHDAILVEEPSAESPDNHANHRPNGADCHDGCPPAETPAEEAASAPPAAEQPVPDTQPAPQGETPQEAAYDLARTALTCADPEVLRTLYRGAGSDLRILDVLPVVDDADLSTLNAPEGLTTLALGSLILEAGKYVAAHGIAVRDPEPERAFDGDTPPPAEGEDPWATDTNVPNPLA